VNANLDVVKVHKIGETSSVAITKLSDSGDSNTRRKIEINDSINDSFLSHLGHKRPINDSNNEIGFELL
jgi:hypothetical protein